MDEAVRPSRERLRASDARIVPRCSDYGLRRPQRIPVSTFPCDRWRDVFAALHRGVLTRLWASGRDDVWWASAQAEARHWNGASLSGTGHCADAIAGSSPTDVWGTRTTPGFIAEVSGVPGGRSSRPYST